MMRGTVVTGRGEGASFTALEWAREQFVSALGIDPYPGTLNLIVHDPADVERWRDLRAGAGVTIDPPNPASCRARVYPVRLAGTLPAAIVLPDVPDYPPDQIELIAALPLRSSLSLADGDALAFEACQPLGVTAVIFDVDGTLVDSLTAFRIVAERAAEGQALVVTDAHVREALNTDRAFWELVLPESHPDRANVMTGMKRAAARQWPAVLREHGRVFPEVSALLDGLRARGARLGIVTGARRTSLEPLAAAGLLAAFDAVITGADVARRKPDPEGLLACASALGVEPGAAVYIGDTPLDVRAAHAAGMAAVAMLTGAGDSALLSACGPHRIVSTHARILDALTISRSQA